MIEPKKKSVDVHFLDDPIIVAERTVKHRNEALALLADAPRLQGENPGATTYDYFLAMTVADSLRFNLRKPPLPPSGLRAINPWAWSAYRKECAAVQSWNNQFDPKYLYDNGEGSVLNELALIVWDLEGVDIKKKIQEFLEAKEPGSTTKSPPV